MGDSFYEESELFKLKPQSCGHVFRSPSSVADMNHNKNILHFYRSVFVTVKMWKFSFSARRKLEDEYFQ